MGFKILPGEKSQTDEIEIDDEDVEVLVEEVDIDDDDKDGISDEDLEMEDAEENKDLEMEDEAENVEVEPKFDHAISTFHSPTEPVYSCTFHPAGRIAACGCEDEFLYIWDTENNEILLKEKYEDSVVLVQFSHDGKYLAAADMFGYIKFWKYSDTGFTQLTKMQFKNPSWMEWHSQTNVLVFAESEQFCMWKVPTFDQVKYFPLDGYSQAGCILPDGKRALIGYDEGYAAVLDLTSFTVKSKLKHIGNVGETGYETVSVAAHPDNNLVALGTERGRVILFTTQKVKEVGVLFVEELDGDSHVESLKFGQESLAGLLLVAFNKFLNIYDYSRLMLRYQVRLSSHATRMVCIEPNIYIGTASAVVDVCDCRTGTKIFSLEGHRKPILDIALSKDKCKIITASDDHTVKIFSVINSIPEKMLNPMTSG